MNCTEIVAITEARRLIKDREEEQWRIAVLISWWEFLKRIEVKPYSQSNA